MSADSDPRQPARSAAATSSTATASPAHAATARFRTPQRPSRTHDGPSLSPRPPLQPRRRSSLISLSSIDDVTRTFTDEYINPRTGSRRESSEDYEMTGWYSSPLAFAMLPALGGLLFKDGSAFVTDVLLLGLAAIFMNWSIRLPWDWYYSAQALRREVKPDDADELSDETAAESVSSAGGTPKISPGCDKIEEASARTRHSDKREEAAESLRKQELIALLATFVFPILAAYLLHVIRAQLSGPSNGLVSDYNLSIFLLAAEIRPVRQVVRMIARRTLYLQRTVTGIDDPFASSFGETSTISGLTERMTDLEAKLSEHSLVPPTVNMAQKGDVSDLSIEIRKRYEPRLEGLERAVRRYEKRILAMSMQTEQRLILLETRLQETLTLAAVAAKHSQGAGMVSTGFSNLGKVIAFPVQLLYSMLVWPFVATELLYNKTKILLLGPAPPRSLQRRSSSRPEARERDEGRTHDKQVVRKVSREPLSVRHS